MSDLRYDQPELHPNPTPILKDDPALDALTVEKMANKRLQERLDSFKRIGAGYQCRCAEYERIIAKLDHELKMAYEHIRVLEVNTHGH